MHAAGLRAGRRLATSGAPLRRLSLLRRRSGWLSAQSDLNGEVTALFGVIGCDHRVIAAQAPSFAILFRRHSVRGSQMALQHLVFLPIFKTCQMIVADRLLDRYGRDWFWLFRWRASGDFGQCFMDSLD